MGRLPTLVQKLSSFQKRSVVPLVRWSTQRCCTYFILFFKKATMSKCWSHWPCGIGMRCLQRKPKNRQGNCKCHWEVTELHGYERPWRKWIDMQLWQLRLYKGDVPVLPVPKGQNLKTHNKDTQVGAGSPVQGFNSVLWITWSQLLDSSRWGGAWVFSDSNDNGIVFVGLPPPPLPLLRSHPVLGSGKRRSCAGSTHTPRSCLCSNQQQNSCLLGV